MKSFYLYRHILLLSVAVTLTSCNLDNWKEPDGNDAPSEEAAEEGEVESVDQTIFLTNVDQLRLRRYGDTKSEMITTFDENTPLFFQNEETDYADVIGGHKGPWKRVKSIDGDYEGWVFGAEHFIQTWITDQEIDNLKNAGKAIRIFDNLTKKEMAELTGANFDDSVRGTRFSGYYEYDLGGDALIPNGRVYFRARVFDGEKKEVDFIPCSLTIKEGMPSTVVDCLLSVSTN